MLIAGDFRQCLPVVPSGTSADQLYACLKASYLWRSVQVKFDYSLKLLVGYTYLIIFFQVLKLCTNMRARTTGDTDSARFASWLLEVGNGNLPHDGPDQIVQVSDNFGTCTPNMDILKKSVYPNLNDNLSDITWLRDRAILAPKNSVVDTINVSLLNEMEGQARTYLSVDTVCDQDEAVNCNLCGQELKHKKSIPAHQKTAKCQNQRKSFNKQSSAQVGLFVLQKW